MPQRFLIWVFHQQWLTKHRKVHDWLMKGFERHAQKGNADAQSLFGFLLLHKGANVQSKQSGVRFLKQCASKNQPRAAWQLYTLYRDGQPPITEANAELANKYLTMAKEGEHPLALEVSTP